MEKCKRMKRQLCMSKNWVYSWQWKSSKTRQQYCRLESFAMNTITHTTGSTVKNHISLKTVSGYNATRKTSYRSWFLVYQRVLHLACLLQHPWHIQGKKWSSHVFPQARLTSPPMTSSTVSSESVARQERRDPFRDRSSIPQLCQVNMLRMQERWDLCSSGTPETTLLTKPTKNLKPNKVEDHDREQGDPQCIIPRYRNGCKKSEKILWMIEFLNPETHTPVLLMNHF